MHPDQPHLLITRPLGQHQRFADACACQGFRVSHLPSIEIAPIATPALQNHPSERVDAVLFTSTNAVAFAHRLRPLPWSGVAVHAIGAATQAALQALGQCLSIEPRPPFNSEAYLDQLQAIAPGRLMIIKGMGGRDLIQPKLEKSGWQVVAVDVYQRMLPVVNPVAIEAVFASSAPDIISVTSNEGLSNLLVLVQKHREKVLRTPLVVNSQRGAKFAITLGFLHQPLVASPPGDAGQLLQLQYWQRRYESR